MGEVVSCSGIITLQCAGKANHETHDHHARGEIGESLKNLVID